MRARRTRVRARGGRGRGLDAQDWPQDAGHPTPKAQGPRQVGLVGALGTGHEILDLRNEVKPQARAHAHRGYGEIAELLCIKHKNC
jgi:hypothetical protein